MSRKLTWLVLVTLVAGLMPATRAAGQTSFDCVDVFLMFARGSGQQVGLSEETDAFFAEVQARVSQPVTIATRELGETPFEGDAYPAAGFGFLDFIDQGVPGSFIADYEDSVAEGRREAAGYLNARAAACPNESVVLGGYSQGAQTIGEALFDLTPDAVDRIAFVAFFGDPKLDVNNLEFVDIFGDFGLANCIGRGDFPWERGSIDCTSDGGILGARKPYLPDALRQRVGSWCDNRDAVCSGHLLNLDINPFEAHGGYPDAEIPEAAREVALRLNGVLGEGTFDIRVSIFGFGFDGVDVAFVIDTTGSMGNEIASVKAQVSAVTAAVLGLAPSARVGLVQYRDHTDAFAARVESGFTDDQAAFEAAVDGLFASGGGDFREAVFSGLMTAFNELSWRDNVIKVAVQIGDAPGKDPEPVTGFTLAQVAQRAQEIDPVNVYPLVIGSSSSTLAFATALAEATDGIVFDDAPGQDLADLLLEALDVIATEPIATINGPYIAPISTEILFDASRSFDPDGEIVQYEWDFDNDGTVDLTTGDPIAAYAYPGEYVGLAALVITSDDGGTANAVTEITVKSGALAEITPGVPENVTATADGVDAATVTWDPAPTGAEAFAYAVRDDLGRLLGIVRPDTFGLTVTELPAGARSFSVVAIGELRNSEPGLSNTIFGVEIDIKPGSDSNPVNLKGKGDGVIPVAIIGSGSFDVATVDPSTLAFGPDGARPAHEGGHFEDVDADGILDHVGHYRIRDTGIAAGDTEACLAGTAGGSPFVACGSITTKPG